MREAEGQAAGVRDEPNITRKRERLTSMSVEQRLFVMLRLGRAELQELVSTATNSASVDAPTLKLKLGVLLEAQPMERVAIFLSVDRKLRRNLTQCAFVLDLKRPH